MGTERESRNDLAEFVKITTIGQSVAGQVKSFGVNDNGALVVMEPVLLRDGHDGKWQRYGTVAVGLSADLAAKVDEKKDVGKFLQFTFARTEPTKFGNNKKIFLVAELSLDEIREIAKEAEDMTGQPLPKSVPTLGRESRSASSPQLLF